MTSGKNSNTIIGLVRNVVAALTLVLGTMHLVSLSSIYHEATADTSTLVLAPVQEQPTAVVAPFSRRQLMTKTITAKIGPVVSATYGWQNDHNVVHVVNTRFMQHQPTLEHLGMARLDLFKTFCLPSMLQQSNQQFLWIIWTDPELQGSIRDNLLKLVVKIPNVIVLGAYNEQEDNLRSLYGYSQSEIKQRVLSGDIDLLVSYQEASLTHVLMESDLDADDAFSRTFVETAQAQAALSVGHDFRINSKHSETFCPEFHAEWRFYGHEDNEFGDLVHFHDENFCIKSGMTVVYHTHADARRLSPCNNHDTSKCCPAYANVFNETSVGSYDRLLTEGKSEAAVKDGIVPIWINNDRVMPASELINTVNFFETPRFLAGSYDNQHFFFDEELWSKAVAGCCVAAEEFDDTSFVPGLTITSEKGYVVEDGDFWYDTLAFDWETKISFASGMFAMGGHFNLPDVGGPGAGINIYIDVKINGEDMFHLPGATRGFWGFVSTKKVYDVEFKVGSSTATPLDDFATEGFKIHWLRFAFPPELKCRRSLRTLPDTEKVDEIQSLEAVVLMSRTPTAAGMKNVLPGKIGGGKNSIALATYDEDQTHAWEYMEYNFGVQKASVAEVHARMEHDMEKILVDAFAGQCTPGHSCKESTKSALGYLLDKERLRDV